MNPITFGGCFGWLHAPEADIASDVGVVLCPGLKTDELTGYRSLRQLADVLARAGFPTIRFHYPGTGNSSDPGAVEHWSFMRRSVHDAVDWLRNHAGPSRVVLCGLRFGATLAAVVAEERTDLAGLVLLAPVLRGKSYIRQLEIEAKLQRLGTSGGGLSAGGIELSDETVALINKVDLSGVKLPPDQPVAIYPQAQTPALRNCVETWTARGTHVTVGDFAGLEPMLRLTIRSHEAAARPERIAAWLRASVAVDQSAARSPEVPHQVEIRSTTWTETPARLDADMALFGVLCRPLGQAEADLAVVIGNTGGDPHCAAVTVDFARRLAAAGIASLRMDFSGLGDSVAPGDAETHVLETDRRREIVAAIDTLADLGFRRFAVQGLCSAAYHAFHAAVSDPRITSLLMVNLPQFEWTSGDAIEVQALATQSPMEVLRKLCNPHFWKVLYQGRVGLGGRFAGLGLWFARKAAAALQRIAAHIGAKPRENVAQASIARLSHRARTLFLFSEGDAGIAELARAMAPSSLPAGVTVRIVPGLDHSLTTREMRRVAADHMINFLEQEVNDTSHPARAGSASPLTRPVRPPRARLNGESSVASAASAETPGRPVVTPSRSTDFAGARPEPLLMADTGGVNSLDSKP